MTFNNEKNLIFSNPSFIIKNLPTLICPMRNWQLSLILTHWSYCKCKNILQTLYVYKIHAKEAQMKYQFHKDDFGKFRIFRSTIT